MKITFFALLLLIFSSTIAQKDSTQKIDFSFYGDIYYSYNFAKSSTNEKENFVYNHKRHNEFNVNLLLARANYSQKKVRANIGLMAGNYPEYTLSAEPKWAQFVYEANIGVKLSSKKNIWLDGGIMPSHIGFESAISADCYTLTRSILAENSPYYETGVKLGYTSANEKLNLALLVLNGWQKIRRLPGNQTPSVGMQMNYKPKAILTLNYSNFLGTDKPDSLNAFRSFHNFYLIYDATSKLSLIAGFDFGTDKYTATKYGNWFAPIAIIRYKPKDNFATALRVEYYDDAKAIIIPTNFAEGVKLFGVSTNVDYSITKNVLCRVEAKYLSAQNNIFSNNKKQNVELTTNLCFRF
jgi:hypothetical protein